jgi:hypothetical protein
MNAPARVLAGGLAPSGVARREELRAFGHHVYGTSAALKFEIDDVPAKKDEGKSRFSIAIDFARAADSSYAWDAKIPFKFTLSELPELASVLMGYSKTPLTLSNHGPEKNKRLELTDQGQNLFIKARQGAKAIALPIGPADTHACAALCLVALQWNSPHLDSTTQLALLRRVAQMRDQRKSA